MTRRFVLTTGGTGGHIFPALAVAEELRARHPEVEILFVGGLQGPEGRLAREAGLRFLGLPVRGFIGRGTRALGALVGLGRGLFLAWRELGRFKPQAVLGLGGYAAAAAVMAARLRRIPICVHEQNSVPGVSNRLCGRWARTICLSFPDARGDFDAARTVMTGNPVRESIRELGRSTAGRGLRERGEGDGGRVLVLGGSQGARSVNTAVVEALPELRAAGVTLRHQTGEKDLERTREGYRRQGADESQVTAFITDMAAAYAWADLVVCRAGATTVAELAVAGKPAVFIPFPQATHDHQRVNARFVEQAGGATLLDETELPSRPLGRELPALLSDHGRLAAMAEAARGFGRPDAARAVAEALEALAGGQKE